MPSISPPCVEVTSECQALIDSTSLDTNELSDATGLHSAV